MIKTLFKNDPAITFGRMLLVAVMTGSAMFLNRLGALPLNFGWAVWSGLAFCLFSPLLRLGHIKLAHWGWDYGQMMLNVAWIFLFIRITGGSENPFSLLFFLAIIAAANARLAKGAIFTATISGLAYALSLSLEYQTFRKAALLLSEKIDFVSAFSADFLFRGYIYAICFYLVAAFAGLLAERLQAKGKLLEAANQAWEELRLSTGDILEKMGSGLLTLNLQGQIKFCNRAGAQILGLDPVRMTGAGHQSLLTGGLTPLSAVLQQSLLVDARKIIRHEVTLTLKDGQEIPLGISTNAIRYGDGRLQGIIAIFQDLTEAKKIETRLQEMERLENVRELTQNLLQVVQPAIEQINLEAAALMKSPDHSQAAGIIKQKAEAIKKTLADFIRFARIENPEDHASLDQPGDQEGAIIGQSKNFLDIIKLARQVAPSQSTVLILGESGTGKELVARELHRLSPRSAAAFVSINCAALPETLLESELFGHVKGSFTGAFRDKPGLFQAAEGGTFLLDEVSETSPAIQVKLLRVLQEREVVPVGGSKPIKVDVRLISATNVDLYKAVEEGKFRRDLFYRLNVIQMELPPLRQRGQDILMLAEYFLNKYCRRQGKPAKALSLEAREFLLGYRWPGNVRELENVMERAVVLSQGPAIEKSHLPAELFRKPAAGIPDRPEEEVLSKAPSSGSLKDDEKQKILTVLQNCGGNKTLAAKKLGIHYATLYRKLKLYGIKQ